MSEVASDRDRDRVVAARSQQQHGDFGFVRLPPLPTVDGLISPAEERYLYWLTSSLYAGEGAVVELGSWFGRSAIALGAGLRDAGYDSALYCFDRFLWRESFNSSVKIADVQLGEGGDFMPYFLANVRPVYPDVRATKTTIEELTWDGSPIELLFVDAPKSFVDLAAALLAFGPALTVDRSLLILQDFFFSPAFPLSMTVAAMADDVELVHTVQGSSTAAFVLRRPLPTAVPDHWRYWTMDDDVIDVRWRALMAKIPSQQRSLAEPALAFYHLERNQLDKARQHMRQIEFSPAGQKRLDFLRQSSAWGAKVAQLVETG